jgi:nucleoside-diphosphate-sugar epimerase
MGKTVRVLAKGTPAAGNEHKLDGNGVVWGDIRERKAIEQAVVGVDTVIHLISNFRRGGSDKKEAYAVNVDGTMNLLEVSLKHGVKQFIHCSTIGVHGNVQTIPADEECAFNPGDLYQETKLIAEKRVWEFSKKTGLPVTVVRPISMCGPGDMRMLKLFRSIKDGWFMMVGNGDALFQPAYIDDVVRGFLLCLNNQAAIGQVFIIGGDEYVPLRELVRMIARELHVPPPRFKMPLKPVIWLATLCESVCVPLGVEPPLHRRRVSFFQNNRAFSVDKAKRILNYEPEISIEKGIQRTIRWYKEHGFL